MKLHLPCVFVVMTVLHQILHAQSGAFRSRVLDAGEVPVPNVMFRFGHATMGYLAFELDDSGYVDIPGLSPGGYDVEVSASGYVAMRAGITIVDGYVSRTDFLLAGARSPIASDSGHAGRASIEPAIALDDGVSRVPGGVPLIGDCPAPDGILTHWVMEPLPSAERASESSLADGIICRPMSLETLIYLETRGTSTPIEVLPATSQPALLLR